MIGLFEKNNHKINQQLFQIKKYLILSRLYNINSIKILAKKINKIFSN